MAKRIALNRVPGESDIGHQRGDAGIAQIDNAVKDPHQSAISAPSITKKDAVGEFWPSATIQWEGGT